jgi:hypothetical protein
MSEAVSPLLHIPLWRAQGQLYRNMWRAVGVGSPKLQDLLLH